MSSGALLLGVGLAVVSAILSNLGLNLQKRNHLNNHSKIAAEAAEQEEQISTTHISKSHKHKHRRRKHSHRKKHRVQPNDILIKKDSNGNDIDHTIDISRRSSFAESTNNFDEISSTTLDDSSSFVARNSSDNEEFMSQSNSFINNQPHSDVTEQPKSPVNHDEAHSKINYTKQLLWQCGLALVVIGSIFDFAALAFAPQTVIAPLGSLTLVSNVFLAPLLLKEKLRRRDVLCTLVIVIGAATAVLCASHDDATPTVDEMFGYFLDTRFIMYAIVVVVCVVVLRLMVWKAAKLRKLAHSDRLAAKKYEKVWTKYHRFGYSAAAGIMGAQSVLFAKCTSTLFRTMIIHGDIMFVHPGTYGVLVGLGITIFFQIRWLNSGLRLFPALYVVPVFQSFWILVSVISGMIFFQEYQGVMDAPLNAFGFCAGLALTITGVYFLSQKSAAATTDETTEESNLEHAEPRRNSLSSSSSFEPNAYMSSDNENVSVVVDVSTTEKPASYFDVIRARKREKEVGTVKQRLLPDDEKENIVQLPHSMAPKRASSKHSTVMNGARYLSPLPEGHSPASPSQGHPRSPPRLRARSDGDQKQPDFAQQEETTISEHEAALLAADPRPDPRAPAVGSHSFSFTNQFLHPRSAQPGVSPRRNRYRSASFDHIGDFEHTRYKQHTGQALNFGAALSALTSPRDGEEEGFEQTPSPRRPKQSWESIQRVAAFNAPGVSAFAQVLGVRNYEREPGSASSSSGDESSDESSGDEKTDAAAVEQSTSIVGSYGATSSKR